MNCLEIADSFEPYYEGRTPFARTSRTDREIVAEALPDKGRFGSDTIEASARPSRREPALRRPVGG